MRVEGGELTRAAVSLRVTMMMGQTGRYLESRRAVWPLELGFRSAFLLLFLQIISGILPGGQDQDGTGVQFQTGADGSHGDGFDRICGSGSEIA